MVLSFCRRSSFLLQNSEISHPLSDVNTASLRGPSYQWHVLAALLFFWLTKTSLYLPTFVDYFGRKLYCNFVFLTDLMPALLFCFERKETCFVGFGFHVWYNILYNLFETIQYRHEADRDYFVLTDAEERSQRMHQISDSAHVAAMANHKSNLSDEQAGALAGHSNFSPRIHSAEKNETGRCLLFGDTGKDACPNVMANARITMQLVKCRTNIC